jgi:hypothetical protein
MWSTHKICKQPGDEWCWSLIIFKSRYVNHVSCCVCYIIFVWQYKDFWICSCNRVNASYKTYFDTIRLWPCHWREILLFYSRTGDVCFFKKFWRCRMLEMTKSSWHRARSTVIGPLERGYVQTYGEKVSSLGWIEESGYVLRRFELRSKAPTAVTNHPIVF